MKHTKYISTDLKKATTHKSNRFQFPTLFRIYKYAHIGNNYSTVTDFAKLRGWSTSVPLMIAT